VIVPPAYGASGDLEDRLSVVSKMLEEAVELLRNTMDQVRKEAEGEPHGDTADPDPDPDPRPG
jgi:hypothetical protein